DGRQLKAERQAEEANLAGAEAQLAKLEAMPRREEVPPSAAKVLAAKADLELAQDLFRRVEQLLPNKAASEEEFQQRRFAMDKARQQLAQAEAEDKLLKAGAWQQDKSIARASVGQMRAQIEQTKTEIERAQVRAPLAGEILQVNVRAGEYVGTPPSQALIVMGNTRPLHVRVDIDEHDIPRWSPTAPAHAAVRG